jgi:carbonic anhydrase
MSAELIERLREGNRRFAAGRPRTAALEARRREVAQGQAPFAEVLGCVDSRVPPELIFDQGLGDLFVIRTAGLVLDRAALGSLEFGVAELGIPLLVVLGHQRCGAVKAALEAQAGHAQPEGEIGYLVEALKPALAGAARSKGDLWDLAAKDHVLKTIERLKRSPVLGAAVGAGRLEICAGWYDLDSGRAELHTP